MSSLVPLSFERDHWSLTHNSNPADYKNTFVRKALPKALLDISTSVWSSESLHRIENTSRSYIVSTTNYILHQWNCLLTLKLWYSNTIRWFRGCTCSGSSFNSWTNTHVTQKVNSQGHSRTTCTKHSCKDTNIPPTKQLQWHQISASHEKGTEMMTWINKLGRWSSWQTLYGCNKKV